MISQVETNLQFTKKFLFIYTRTRFTLRTKQDKLASLIYYRSYNHCYNLILSLRTKSGLFEVLSLVS